MQGHPGDRPGTLELTASVASDDLYFDDLPRAGASPLDLGSRSFDRLRLILGPDPQMVAPPLRVERRRATSGPVDAAPKQLDDHLRPQRAPAGKSILINRHPYASCRRRLATILARIPVSSTTSYAAVGDGRCSWHLCSPEGDDRPDVWRDDALAEGPRDSAASEMTGPLLHCLGDLLRLSALLDEPELRELLDQHLHIAIDMPRRHHEAVISRAGLLPMLWRELEPSAAVERYALASKASGR